MRNDSIKLKISSLILFLTSVWFSGCSDDNPKIGPDLIDKGMNLVLSSISSDTLPGSFSVEYVDYNPITSNSTRIIVGTNSTEMGTVEAGGVFRLVADSKSFEPDSLIKIISARFFLSPFYVTANSKSGPYNTGDTTQTFNIKISALGERTYFSQVKLKDDLPVSGIPVADTSFSGNKWGTFSFAATDTNWVRKMISTLNSLSDTSLQFQENYGLKIYSGNSNNRSLGFYGFASNESIYYYEYEPRLEVTALVRSGNSVVTAKGFFYLGSANQISRFTKKGPYWAGNNYIVLAGLSGLRPLIKFSDPGLIPSKSIIHSSTLSAKIDTSLSSVNGTDYLSVWNSTSTQLIQSPAVSEQFGTTGQLSFNISSLTQFWSLNSVENGFFMLPAGELNRSEMQAIFLTHADPAKKLTLHFVYSGL